MNKGKVELGRMSVFGHLRDLRRALLISGIAVLGATALILGLWQDQLLRFVISPLREYNVTLVNIGLPEAFFAKFKVSLLAGMLLSLPVICWQVWSFLAPALLKSERRILMVLGPLSVVLFLLGAAFAYWGVFRYAAKFLLIIAGEDIKPMLSVGQYVSFLVSFLIPFGVIFELPLVSFFLSRLELLTPGWLRRNRKYAILGIFVLAAVLTPTTDMISQFMMAGPMMVLYEASIVVSRLSSPRRKLASRPVRAARFGRRRGDGTAKEA